MTQHLYCGVDIGASATKLVLVDESGEALARVVRPSGVDYQATARSCLEQALDELVSSTPEVVHTVSTGYGRRNVDFADRVMTEIHCHGVGCFHQYQQAMVIIDIGGQDNKIIHVGDDGKRVKFKMNRKCAAGTGAFIEEIALRLDLDVGEMNALAASTEESVRLNSFCTVFAKTEILSHLRQGAAVAEIVRGAFRSVVERVTEMAVLDGTVVLTGGVVAHNPTVAELMAERIGRPVTVPDHPQFTGAHGAALTAMRQESAPEPK